GKVRLVSAVGGYHGKTMGALSVTAKDLYQQPFRPLLPDVAHVPFGDAEALERDLRNGPDACVVIEPVQSEAGVILPPAGYVADVARLCRQYGAFLILDEIFTGLGRVGSWWAADREGVSPDVLLVGKGLSGGIVPVAAAVATKDAFREFDRDPYLHTSTFSGAPIAMAAVRAAIETIAREGLVERAAAIGAHLLDQVRSSAAQRCPHLVREVRGAGLLIGVEMAEAGLAGEMLSELLERRVIVNHSLNASNVLRLTPPAVLTAAETDHLVTAFDESFRILADRYPTADRLGDR
ncbi:MAG TPA: aminotransferase class III-fold pyridoxal phosphate-dependent enzyme, partial [Micromonosporaceae bacterium]|nr:aminotransferase class III-fold pyridoxal phosphate-dependent enzyme [Micromonosporaceae bacterium]